MNVDVNINDYLSEEDKKEIAIDVFRQQVKKELFNSNDGTVQADSEVQRIMVQYSNTKDSDGRTNRDMNIDNLIEDFENMREDGNSCMRTVIRLTKQFKAEQEHKK